MTENPYKSPTTQFSALKEARSNNAHGRKAQSRVARFVRWSVLIIQAIVLLVAIVLGVDVLVYYVMAFAFPSSALLDRNVPPQYVLVAYVVNYVVTSYLLGSLLGWIADRLIAPSQEQHVSNR